MFDLFKKEKNCKENKDKVNQKLENEKIIQGSVYIAIVELKKIKKNAQRYQEIINLIMINFILN